MALSKKPGSPYWYTRFTVGGLRIQESTKFEKRSDAKEYEEKRIAELKQQVLLGKQPLMTWKEAVIRWKKEIKGSIVCPRDLSRLRWLSEYLDGKKLIDIDKALLTQIVSEQSKKCQSSTINRTMNLLKSILNIACKKWGWVNSVPHFEKIKEKPSIIRWLTEEEANRLLNALPEHLREIAIFSLATGLRKSNVLGLKWEWIDMNRKHFSIPASKFKNRKYFGAPLNKDAMEVLKRQLGKHNEYVFTYEGDPIRTIVHRTFKKALIKAKIQNFRWHDFRHTWASWHVQRGTSLQELYELGGWNSYKMVLVYAHLSSSHLRAAAERNSGLTGAKLVHLKIADPAEAA